MQNLHLSSFLEESYSPPDLWYIASPYHHPDLSVRTERVRQVQTVVDYITQKYVGVAPFSPIIYTHDMATRGITPDSNWYIYDLAFLAKADRLVILKLDGYLQSTGIAIETSFALAKGIEIYRYDLDEFLSEELPL